MTRTSPPKIWWSNGIFFVAVHIGAFIGMYCKPYYAVPWPTLVSAVALWQLADFGHVKIFIHTPGVTHSIFFSLSITIGYHRLYSHRSFRACLPVRLVLAALGSAGFQGSIKVRSYISSFMGSQLTSNALQKWWYVV
jgi:stearoyl-CoA desaturase (delta-9 desaturase)